MSCSTVRACACEAVGAAVSAAGVVACSAAATGKRKQQQQQGRRGAIAVLSSPGPPIVPDVVPADSRPYWCLSQPMRVTVVAGACQSRIAISVSAVAEAGIDRAREGIVHRLAKVAGAGTVGRAAHARVEGAVTACRRPPRSGAPRRAWTHPSPIAMPGQLALGPTRKGAEWRANRLSCWRASGLPVADPVVAVSDSADAAHPGDADVLIM